MNTESKQARHTPGPWTVEIDHATEEAWESGVQRIEINSPKHLIATYKTEYIEYPNDAENVANARLIAAAPELLGACIAYMADRKEAGCTIDSKAVKAMRAAITKATGSAS